MKNKKIEKECKHKWIFDYQEFYDGIRPGYSQDVFHCSKCLERKHIEIDGEFHHKTK